MKKFSGQLNKVANRGGFMGQFKMVRLAPGIRMTRFLLIASLALLPQGCGIENLVDDPDVEVRTELEERFFQVPLPRVDVLWIMDDTGSMAAEQARLADSFKVFVQGLDALGIDFQLGVVTTDMSGEGGGVLLGNPWVVTALHADPVEAFLANSDVGTAGTGPEAGLAAMVAALKEPNRSGANRGFRREDAALHVVVLSDANDRSGDWLGVDPVSTAQALLEDERQRTQRSARFSAVVGDAPFGCFSEDGSAEAGTRYLQVAADSGGSQASICSDDFGPLLENLGAVGVEYPVRFPLQAEPNPDSVRVSLGGVLQEEGWSLELDPAAVVFDAPPAPEERIDVQYRLEPEE